MKQENEKYKEFVKRLKDGEKLIRILNVGTDLRHIR